MSEERSQPVAIITYAAARRLQHLTEHPMRDFAATHVLCQTLTKITWRLTSDTDVTIAKQNIHMVYGGVLYFAEAHLDPSRMECTDGGRHTWEANGRRKQCTNGQARNSILHDGTQT